MRILKLVIWDLDETILIGILEEGEQDTNPVALRIMQQLDHRGVLQALATQNQPEIIPPAIKKFGWSDFFVRVEADLGPKAKKVKRILEALETNPVDAAFVDEDPFERGSIRAQIPDITVWTMSELEDYLEGHSSAATKEGRRRPQMYREQQVRSCGRKDTADYTDFLRSCNIQISIRPYTPEDSDRAEELLTRTHRMNLGGLPVDEAVARLKQPAEHTIIMAEMKDVYGDMGRCGILHLTPDKTGAAIIESLALSCRTRARGLSLAMLVGMLRHRDAQFDGYRCRYVNNGYNRPLRMLLMGAGFKPQPGNGELVLNGKRLASLRLPDWIKISYLPVFRED